MDKWMIDPKENIIIQEPPSYTNYIIPVLVVFIFFIIFLIYYAIKYNIYEKHFIINQNAEGYQVTLEDIKQDIKNTWRTWMEKFEYYRERYLFESQITNGVFHKSKAIDFVNSFSKKMNRRDT